MTDYATFKALPASERDELGFAEYQRRQRKDNMTGQQQQKPEALRLADRLDDAAKNMDMGRPKVKCLDRDAAAELRRLHAENEALRKDAERWKAVRDRHAYAISRCFNLMEGFRSDKARAAIEAWADAAVAEVAEWDAKSVDEKFAWYQSALDAAREAQPTDLRVSGEAKGAA